MRKFRLLIQRSIAQVGWEGALVVTLSLIALVVAVIDLVGGQSLSPPVLVGILSLFLLELLSLRVRLASQQASIHTQLDALHNRITDLVASIPFGIRLENRRAFQNIQLGLADCADIAIRGSSLHGFVSSNRGFIRKKAVAGCKFRLLVMDPEYYKQINTSSADQPHREKRDIEHVVGVLEEILKDARKQNPTADIQLRYLSYPPQFGLLMMDAEQPTGKIQVEMYFYYKTDQDERPHFEITRAMDERWYAVFKEQFEVTWEHSREHVFGRVVSPL